MSLAPFYGLFGMGGGVGSVVDGNAPFTIGTASDPNSGTTLVVTVGAAGVAAGTRVIVSATCFPQGGTFLCADSKGNTYATVLDNKDTVTSILWLKVFSSVVVTALVQGDTITITWSVPPDNRAVVAQGFPGYAGPLDKTAVATGFTNAPSSGATAVTTQADELVYGGIALKNVTLPATITPGTGYTAGPNASAVGGGGPIEMWSEYKIVAATGAQTASASFSSSQLWNAGVMTFKAGVIDPEFGSPIGDFGEIGTASNDAAGTTLTITVGAAGVPVGTHVIVPVGFATVAGAVSVADSKSNTYASDKDNNDAVTSNTRNVILSGRIVTALVLNDTIVITTPSATLRAASARGFTGILSASAADKNAAAVGTSQTPSSGVTAVISQANELVFGSTVALRASTVPTYTAGAGYTPGTRADVTNGVTALALCPEFKITEVAAAQTADGSLAVAGAGWNDVVVTYRGEAPAAPGGPVADRIDTFNRANNAALGTPSDAGTAWTEVPWSIASSAAAIASLTTGLNVATLDMLGIPGRFRLTLGTVDFDGRSLYILARRVDANDFQYLKLTFASAAGGTVTLVIGHVVGGLTTDLFTLGSAPIRAGDTIDFECFGGAGQGCTMRAYVNGLQIGVNALDLAPAAPGTLWGLAVDGTGFVGVPWAGTVDRIDWFA